MTTPAANTTLEVAPDGAVESPTPPPQPDRSKEPIITVADTDPMGIEMLKYIHSARVPRHGVIATDSTGQRYRLSSVFAATPKTRTIRDAARALNPTRAANTSRKNRRGYR